MYSPDGDQIAVAGEAGLWIATMPDGHATRITDDTDWPLTWTKDWIYFARVETAASGRRYPGIYRIALEDGTPQLYARLPKDCDNGRLAGTPTLSLDASIAVCIVLDQRHDVHIVENFDAGQR